MDDKRNSLWMVTMEESSLNHARYHGYEILLGSGSPRRRELLGMMDIPFRHIAIKDVEEVFPSDMPAENVPAYLSHLKADAYRTELKANQLLITADTDVILDGKILGKPSNAADAVDMIRRLSGQVHKVVSGVTLTTTDRQRTFAETTTVKFCKLSDEQIIYYVDRYKPLDKAGAYGIQEWIGLTGIEAINGCFYNVMGLPTAALYRELQEFIGS